MISIRYDPHNGVPFRDGDIDAYIQVLSELTAIHDTFELVVGTDNIIEGLRAAIVQRKIPHTEIQFLFNDIIISVASNGQLSEWPEGFADFTAKNVSIANAW